MTATQTSLPPRLQEIPVRYLGQKAFTLSLELEAKGETLDKSTQHLI